MVFLLKKVFRIARFAFLAALIFILTVIFFGGQVASYVFYAYAGIALLQVLGFVLDSPAEDNDVFGESFNIQSISIENTLNRQD